MFLIQVGRSSQSPLISIAVSLSPPDQRSSTAVNAMKVSDWVKSLKTPDKTQCSEDVANAEDSAKKKPKFIEYVDIWLYNYC